MTLHLHEKRLYIVATDSRRRDREESPLFSCADRVVSRVSYRGTHVGDFKAVPATGKTIENSGIDIFEFVDGKVAQHWHETDHLVMFSQLGAELQSPSR